MVASPIFEGTPEELFRRLEEVKTPERLTEALNKGLASPVRDVTAADWAELKRRAAERAQGAAE